ncbi:MAG: CrcB family protein [Nitriliruptorales bacterium]|nr:CrcB family protein [Nitriliruptorales bacterium]
MIGVAIAGGLGALLRGELAAIAERRGWRLGRATLLINVLGAAAMGLAVGRWGIDGVPASLGNGFLAGFTTFSAWMVEAIDLPDEESRRGLRAGILLAMLVMGLGAAAGGMWLGGLA